MKIISDGKILEKELLRCLHRYELFAFATAWASADTPVLKSIIRRKGAIQYGVIGTHFYQTDPKVLVNFIGDDRVRFRMQPSGVFHPKVYLFWNESSWEMFVGSANMTRGGLGTNAEIIAHIDDGDGAQRAKAQLLHAIAGYWKSARVMTAPEAKAYGTAWLIRRPSREQLSGYFGRRKSVVHPADTVLELDWDGYLSAIGKAETAKRLRERSGLLAAARDAFLGQASYAAMDDSTRRMIAGLPSDAYPESGWFGSMVGAGVFFSAVRKNSRHLSAALDHIPLRGDVSRTSYDAYLDSFRKAFPNGRHGIATATRLLAMKRPDQFVCLDGKNRSRLCRNFGIPASGMTYQRYWDEIIEQLRLSPWWRADAPHVAQGREIWLSRAAMLDAIFYED